MSTRQRKSIIIIIFFCIFCGSKETSEFKELRVIPGDRKILIQWEFSSPYWYGGPWDGFDIIRSKDKKTWESILECYPIDLHAASYWSSRFGQFLDTTVENNQKYFYRANLVGFEWGDASDIVSGIARAGLPNPRPIGPHSLNVSYSKDSSVIVIRWVPPQGCDGLYYFYSSGDSNSFDWTPYAFFDPFPLQTQLAVKNRKDGSREYYKFVTLVDGILSEPSEAVLIEHKE